MFKPARVAAYEQVQEVPAALLAGGVCNHPLQKSGYDFDVPLLDDLRELRDIIFRKYQRRRASAEDFEAVDKMLRDQTRDG